MQTPTLGLVAVIGVLVLVGVAYYTGRLRWYVAAPLVVLVVLVAMAAQAQASVHVHWKLYDGQCYRYSVTEYRDGVLGHELWHLNERLDWCQSSPGSRVWSGPTVHRSHGTNLFWVFDGYQAKTQVRHLSSPSRWRVYVKAAFTGSPDFYGLAEHNYPSLRLTIYKANPSHVHYAASCGC